ncbi:MAG: hypothetical protein KBG48_17885 [Kofleriaceae bacterium]|jgi:hypothetical protein|nr:hypothetical protein [Kofleriaceae bacterium]MBP9169274.1 hypothetical protein [Kofleriaceae bacterium]MBP9859017.1 hypothetical protein [Kofleriaceae bacterium]
MSLVLPSVGRPTGRDPASWLDRVVRLVPIEILSPYLLAVEVARPTGPLALALVGVGLVATVAGLALHARHHRLAVAPGQHALRGTTFLAWAFAIANPLAPGPAIDPRIAAGLTVVVPALGALLFTPAGATPAPARRRPPD